MRNTVHTWMVGLAVALVAAGASAQAPSEEAYEYFSLNCKSCHTIGGGKLTGPDLKGVMDRADREWLVEFIQHPKAVIDSGDAYAATLPLVVPCTAAETSDR